jgi:iron complex outermembrane receptor protein
MTGAPPSRLSGKNEKGIPVFSPKLRILPWSIALAFPVATLLGGPVIAADQPTLTLPAVHVSEARVDPTQGTTLDKASLAGKSAATSDTARLLADVPGVSFYGAGGVSSLPTLHGLADDRLRIKVDGMDLISACANHMNPPLSYIDPSNVASIQVFTGITPVSMGGDSIGGAIVVNSAAPEFARSGQGALIKGQVGAFFRSNGNAKGANVALTVANENLSMNYQRSSAQSENYEAAADFKSSLVPTATVKVPGPREVGSSLYKSENQSLGVAVRHQNHLLELKLGRQDIPYQGFPNQRMDMTRNQSDQARLRYTGQYQWGALEASMYQEDTRHTMNFLENKLASPTSMGMPMDTDARNTGASVKADLVLSERDTVKLGGELQHYRLNDWWDPISATAGMMAPNKFWNIADGQRDRADVFGEWLARWNTRWSSQVGVRSSSVTMDAGKVQGYNTMSGMMGYGDPANPSSIPGAFNALDHKKTDSNLDLAALARFTPDNASTFEAGYSRKTRSPNLYERFAWSTNNNMVMNMINWTGDANGYVGNLNLKPELAHTLSASASWQDAAREQWGLQLTSHYSYIQDYIDAVPCALVGKTCPARTDKFVNLSFANQNARIYGLDLSGHSQLANSSAYGKVTLTGALSAVKGHNADTDDKLYNIMPTNLKLAIAQRVGNWTNTIEAQLVDAKSELSQVRNEIGTAGYGLLNLRTSYEWEKMRLDIGIENALDKFYASPLGGAYVGQSPKTWGIAVPGAGRSIYAGVTAKF